jgi:hypothetical protein
MRYFNIDKGLELPQQFNIMHNALDELYARRQEDFQKQNPLMEIYKMVPLKRFQKSYGSSTGFTQAFEQTVDYASYPGFTSGGGFRTTVSYKAFNGKVVVTWQMILEADYAGITEMVSDFQLAWQRQVIEYGIFALTAFFGGKIFDPVSKSWIKITSADTTDGDPMGDVKNPVFTNAHTIVRKDDMTDAKFDAALQSNKFYIDVALDGSDIGAHQKIANGLYQIKVYMNKLKNDNNKRAGLRGNKHLVMTEDAHLNQAIESVIAAEHFSVASGKTQLNPIKGNFTTYVDSHLDGNDDQPIPQFASDNGIADYAVGMLMLDKTYNKQNKGPIMLERVKFSLDVVKTKDPESTKYLGKQAFDFYCPSWRGLAYILIGNPTTYYGLDNTANAWANPATFTEVTPVANYGSVNIANIADTPVA